MLCSQRGKVPAAGAAESAARLESTSYWCTYQRHCGNVGTQVTGGRASGIVECWGRTRAGNPPPPSPPPGNRPKERRAPSLGLEGTNPRTGRRFFFNKKRLNDSTKLLEADVSEFVWEFYSGLGAWHCLHLFMYSWFFSLILLRFGLVFLRFWKLSFSVQTDSNTRGRTTPTGALQCHYVAGTSRFRSEGRLSDGSLRRWRPISVRFSAPTQGGSLSAFPSLWSFVRTEFSLALVADGAVCPCLRTFVMLRGRNSLSS